MELLVRSALVAATKSPFSKAFVRLEKLVPESPATVLTSLENSAVRQFPARWSGGLRIEDGAFGSVVAGSGDEKPIFKGVCAAGETCAGVAGDGFNFSGKFGSAAVSGEVKAVA